MLKQMFDKYDEKKSGFFCSESIEKIVNDGWEG